MGWVVVVLGLLFFGRSFSFLFTLKNFISERVGGGRIKRKKEGAL